MRCTKCGCELPENSKFCFACGAEIDPAEEQKKIPAEEQETAGWETDRGDEDETVLLSEGISAYRPEQEERVTESEETTEGEGKYCPFCGGKNDADAVRSEEHTSELQSQR